MSKRKKTIVLSCMILLLAITATLNFVLTGNIVESPSVETPTVTTTFSNYRSNRASTRNEELLQLDAIIASADSNSSEKSTAVNMKIKLTEMTENELLLETLIKAQGFEDCAVIIGSMSNNVNVLVKDEHLDQNEAVKIYTLVAEELNVSAENVKITPIS